jgi:hypothetical protein
MSVVGGNSNMRYFFRNLLAGEFEIDSAYQGAKELENGLFTLI